MEGESNKIFDELLKEIIEKMEINDNDEWLILGIV